uniref:RNase NYN domain-containing protein n=1 Tax=Anopheles minimus TaxID=112268 RepID=A0A182WIL0_9DIPT
MFSGSLCPGRYLTFSCVVLMISVSFLPSIISSYTYIVTRSSNVDNRFALTPTILAMADPLEYYAFESHTCSYKDITPLSIAQITSKQNNNRISTADTILIEDSDEETESNGENSRPLFYLDRNPGVRDAEVPLYNVCHEIDKPATTVTNQPRPDESVIVLDSTIDQTMNDSLKEMQINVETIQPSSSDTESNSSSKIISNVPIDKQSNRSAATVRNVSPDVIELSDYSDTEPSISYLSKNTTPAFPAMDCIPLGYDVLKPQTSKSAVVQKPQKKSKWNNADNKNTKASPLSEAANLAEKQEVTKRMVIIDGNNVAYGHLNGKMFSVKGLQLCINYFKKLGYEVTAVVPQFRLKRHHSTDYVLLEKMLRGGDITLAPCKNLPGQYSSTYDDRLILSVAEQFDGVIISNDNFRDLLEISPAWRRIIETRVIGYTWVKDCFFLPDDPYGRHGPTLQQILNGKSE